jgi:hypothetical protein
LPDTPLVARNGAGKAGVSHYRIGQQEHPEIVEMDVDRTREAMQSAVLTHALEVQLHGFVSHWCMKATYNEWTETAQDADMEKYLQAEYVLKFESVLTKKAPRCTTSFE